MRGVIRVIALSGILLLAFAGAAAKPIPSPADDRSSIVIVFKDGHRQSFAMAEIVRLDFKTPAVIVYKDGHQEKFSPSDIARIEFGNPAASEMMPGRGHFVGKWEVGAGQWEHVLHHPRRRRRSQKDARRVAWDLDLGRWRGSNQLGRRLARRDPKGGNETREACLRTGQIFRRHAYQRHRRKKYAAETDLARRRG